MRPPESEVTALTFWGVAHYFDSIIYGIDRLFLIYYFFDNNFMKYIHIKTVRIQYNLLQLLQQPQ